MISSISSFVMYPDLSTSIFKNSSLIFWALANDLEHLVLCDVPRPVHVHLQKLLPDLLLSLPAAPDGRPELSKLAHINLLVPVLVRLVDESISFTSGHVSAHLVHKSLQLFSVDFAITVGVKQLESLLKLLLADVCHSADWVC